MFSFLFQINHLKHLKTTKNIISNETFCLKILTVPNFLQFLAKINLLIAKWYQPMITV